MKQELEQVLNHIESNGFDTDVQHIKEDLKAQFHDPYLFIREYVSNAKDAKASHCIISGSQNGDLISIIIEDNGIGMSGKILETQFFNLFNSAKDGNRQKIGQHGIGMFSAFAMDDVVGYEVLTSDSTECYKVKTGNLLKKAPIEIKQVTTPKNFKGTRIKITYKKKNGNVKDELKRYISILEKNVSFLEMNIIVNLPSEKRNATQAVSINKVWPGMNYFYNSTKKIDGHYFNIAVGMGDTASHLYSNGVFITDKYNLLFDENDKRIQYLNIKVNSLDGGLLLPFGRHDIRNPEILSKIQNHVFNAVIEFYNEVFFQLNTGGNSQISKQHFELLTVELLSHYFDKRYPWFSTPILKTVDLNLLSFTYIETYLAKGNKIYVADNTLTGADLSALGVVLEQAQTGNIANIISEKYATSLVTLDSNNSVIEDPTGNQLNIRERTFELSLGLRLPYSSSFENDFGYSRDIAIDSSDYSTHETIATNKTEQDQAEKAKRILKKLSWKVNKLINLIDQTPNTKLLFKYSENTNTVTLNLNHHDIGKLLLFECKKLAAHWAMSMVILDNHSNILKNVESEVRESILYQDLLTRIGQHRTSDSDREERIKALKKTMRKIWLNYN